MTIKKSPSLLGGAMIIAGTALVQVCLRTQPQRPVYGLSALLLLWFTLGFV